MLIEKISSEILTAMKSGNRERLEALKLIKSELQKAEKTGKEYNEVKLISKMVSQYKSDISEFEKVGRKDLQEQYQKQLEIIQEFAPREVDEEEIRNCTIEEIKSLLGEKDELEMKDMKKIIEAVRKKIPSANGGVISGIFKEFLK